MESLPCIKCASPVLLSRVSMWRRKKSGILPTCQACLHPPIYCAHCKRLIENPSTKQRLSTYQNSAMCSRACQNAALSIRRKEYNPMRDREDVRQRCATTLRAMGWKPTVQGGNGKPLPPEQLLLASALGWETEVAVPTKKPRNSGYPTCYKLDVANRVLRVGVEIDGNSHAANIRKSQDKKKDSLLNGLGWRVLRFSKQRVTEHLAECVQAVLLVLKEVAS